jgi:hypothetical protein
MMKARLAWSINLAEIMMMIVRHFQRMQERYIWRLLAGSRNIDGTRDPIACVARDPAAQKYLA